jgi:hypothetical protein
MTIRFLVDYRGVLTAERYYTAGCVVEDSELQAAELVAEGRAEFFGHGPVLDELTIKELRRMAKDEGIKYGGLRKAGLIKAIVGGQT